MNVPFTPQEEIAIKQMAQTADISEEAVVVQAVRLYQLWRVGKIRLSWPKILEHQLYEAEGTPVDIVA
jgi:hypothetical protein